jgi:hypothetical protein
VMVDTRLSIVKGAASCSENPGLKSETWATHSERVGWSLRADGWLWINGAELSSQGSNSKVRKQEYADPT